MVAASSSTNDCCWKTSDTFASPTGFLVACMGQKYDSFVFINEIFLKLNVTRIYVAL